MSVKRTYELKTHIVTEKVVTSERRYCDFCGKEIRSHYWDLVTRHEDWGLESDESAAQYDVCSPECLTKAFQDYINISDNPHQTQEFNVTHVRWSNARGDIHYNEVKGEKENG